MKRYPLLLIALLALHVPLTANAQTGVDDDRVSLPEGPGSLEGVGDDVQIDPNMGGMSHSVSISLPRGFPGASPSLGLSYSSSAGSGPVGIGWSMSTPSIERMTSRGVPEYDSDDLFDVGGGELVQVGSDGADLIYRARFEGGFVRYRWVDAGAEGYWIAEYPDGSRGFFGADSSGAIIASARTTHPTKGTANYSLVEKVDVYGNAARYRYDAFDGTVPLLSGIEWIQDGAGNTVYSVEIDHEARVDQLSDASRGFEEITANRVRYIRAKNGAEVIREYVLVYQDDASAGGFSRLARVENYGLGGRLGGELYPIVQSFDYSQALGAECTGAACDQPYMVDMGTVAGANNFGSGRATLIDINKDALPDIVDTTDTGAHQFFLNTLTPDGSGGFDHSFSTGVSSSASGGTGSAIQLGGSVQTFDVNGDGTSDLLNRTTGQFLLNQPGSADWGASGTFADVTVLQGLDLSQARFIDLDDDKRVDLITSTSTTTMFYRNEGDSFSSAEVDPLGVAIQADSLVQFADMNGDGLNDPIELQTDGSVRYRLNFGLGNWSGWRTITGLSLNVTQRPFADLEDINGDGIADVVIADSGQIQYAINRNGDRFDPFVTITSADINGASIPDRGAGVTVLYADMNANGSEDVVWLLPGGAVQYLELFPGRPNLLTRIENGIGSVQTISYTTAAQESARATAEGNPWTYALSIPMQMASSIDRHVTLTGDDDGSGLHEITMMTYRDGFYDGDEKQYRGFERVERVIEVDSFQEASGTAFVFDVGRVQPHRNGKMLGQVQTSDDEVLTEMANEFDDCAIAEVPTPAELEALGREVVYFTCQTATETVHKERLSDPAEWKTTRTEMTHDGYGNVTLNSELGEVDVTGDELYTETTYAAPTSAWLINLSVEEQVYADPAGPDRAETITYYDGDDFVGLPEGEATHGFVSRVVQRVDNNGATVTTSRARRDGYGNSVEIINPNGSVDDPDTHHLSYAFDETGLFLVLTDMHNVDDEGAPYILRRESRFERNFQKPIEKSQWFIVQSGQAQTAKDIEQVRYDNFGRPSERYLPGDMEGTPSARFFYELGEPFSRVILQMRPEMNEDTLEEMVHCLDGKGRKYQERTWVSTGQYQVTGFSVLNARGQIVERYQPYLSTSDACDVTPPSETLKTTFFYDGAGRVLEQRRPGEAIYGEEVIGRTVYGPLSTALYDGEDNAASVHANTPTIQTRDGLDRPVTVARTLMENGDLQTSTIQFSYDSTGTFAGYEDAEGNRHTLETDLMGRTVRVSNADFGDVTMVYDDASNIIEKTDGRGVSTRFVYDGLNRIKERFDPEDREASLVTWRYDFLPEDCDLTECTNTAGALAAQTYPVDLGQGRVEVGMDRFGYDARRRNIFGGRRLGFLVDLISRTAYDNRDRMISNIHADGTALRFAYDGMGRLLRAPGYIDSMTYDDRDVLAQMTYANGASVEMQYDDLRRLARITHRDGGGALLHDFDITQSRANMVTSVIDDAVTGPRSLSVNYTLDDWYRTLATSFDDETVAMSFDELDRLQTGRVGSLSYEGSGARHLSMAGGGSYNYDAAGQLIGRGEDAYTRDALGRLTRVHRAGEEVGRHVYAEGDRVVQMTTDGSLVLYGLGRFEVRDGIASTYLSSSGWRSVRVASRALMTSIYPDAVGDGEINAADAYVARAQGDEALSTEHVLGAAAARMLDEIEDPVAYFHHDHLGSLVTATDEGGEVRGQRGYFALGALRFTEGHVDVHGFTGQEQDVTTGLIHMQHRELDPATGRWDRFDPAFVMLGQDAIMENPGEASNGYAYVAYRSSTLVDPTGLEGKKPSPVRSKGTASTPTLTKAQAATREAAVGRLRSRLKTFDSSKMKAATWRIKTMSEEIAAFDGGPRTRTGRADDIMKSVADSFIGKASPTAAKKIGAALVAASAPLGSKYSAPIGYRGESTAFVYGTTTHRAAFMSDHAHGRGSQYKALGDFQTIIAEFRAEVSPFTRPSVIGMLIKEATDEFDLIHRIPPR